MDFINPDHYKNHPVFQGVECSELTNRMSFTRGNAVKYLWRHSVKHETPFDDLSKALWYLGCSSNIDQDIPDELFEKLRAQYVTAVEHVRLILDDTAKYYLKLSYRRSSALADYLIKAGASVEAMTEVAFILTCQAILLLVSEETKCISPSPAMYCVQDAIKLYEHCHNRPK